MILIPEIEKILLFVPRTGSTSLKKAVLEKYPNSMLLYRHMEADNVPQGYDRWVKVGIVRHPLDRLWSLYNYLKNFDGNYDKQYILRMNGSVENLSFEEWLTTNNTVFASQYFNNYKDVCAKYITIHQIPENLKSQFITLRPDLGTKIFKFEELHLLAKELDVVIEKTNSAKYSGLAPTSKAIKKHIEDYFSWDNSLYVSEEDP